MRRRTGPIPRQPLMSSSPTVRLSVTSRPASSKKPFSLATIRMGHHRRHPPWITVNGTVGHLCRGRTAPALVVGNGCTDTSSDQQASDESTTHSGEH